jgi:hypothetical protein
LTRDEAIRVLRGQQEALERRGYDDAKDVAKAIDTLAKLPELWGAKRVADELGTTAGNLGRWASLPAPLYDLPTGKLYDAAEIRRVARERRREAAARA